MGKIFGYELRRLLGNKFSAGLAVLTLAYSYWVNYYIVWVCVYFD